MSVRDDDDQAVSLGGALEVLRSIWALDHALHRASRAMERLHGVTGPQRLTIRIVGRFPGISAGRLAELLHVHPSTLTGILRRLEVRGHLRRYPDPRDGRRTLLGLTAAGRTVDEGADGTIETIVGDALELLPPAELAAARRVLASLTDALTGARRGPAFSGGPAK